MSFSSNYYLQLIKNEFEEWKKSTCNEYREILARNIFSRGYYTMMLHCKFELCVNDQGADTHKKVMNAIVQHVIKTRLLAYKAIREQSDYQRIVENQNFNNMIRTQSSIQLFLSEVEQVLKCDKDILENNLMNLPHL